MNILITSAGKRVSLVKSFKQELIKLYPNGKVIAVDLQPKLSAACYEADLAFEVPRIDSEDYFKELITICTKNNIKLIVPTIDTELMLLAKNEKLLLEYGIKTVISSENFISKCRDKNHIHNFFNEHNIEIAKQYSKTDYKLPIFIKPVDGSRSVDTYTILKESDFIKYHFENDKLMFLEYLDHSEHEEFTCDLYYDKNSQLKCAVPRKRIEIRDGEVNKGKTENNSLVPYIKERLSFIEGAKGCLTAQFFKHKTTGRIVGIEINPRFGGGYPLSYLSGANYSKWIIEEYLFDKNIDEMFDCWEDNLLMLRYDNEILVHGFKN
ncbi:ATP-grasp domain-containing protein [Cellulophaga sp. HaHaR_3_176]|uniref:ATP-grasp domain-containing protein n=1 Tax=Cellulophaga sp. HaHaR_3_176 TaxID=1942464 RepID=UPI001C1F4044|nr:ATP-grasp domain-containing protein [Cellulophaga sp. HaHaR_3_176]QWX84791.1 ATP-grasp domain-containing protein [Cellulophaga sp. HaHaR_3_176]